MNSIKNSGKGQIINHSQVPLWIIETDSGRPIVHTLGSRKKSLSKVDADGFRRVDGESILLHKFWWKTLDYTVVDIWQIGSNLLVPTSLAIPVSDQHFGKYEIDNTQNWGEDLTYVSSIIRNKRGKVTGYMIEGLGMITKSKAIQLAQTGKLDNVVVVESKNGTVFLRTKKNTEKLDNLTA